MEMIMSDGRWMTTARALLCAGAMLAMAVPATRANDGVAEDARIERPAPVFEQCPCPPPPR
jgi:uncharacterized protein YdiU (UPF0061 family)